MPRIAPEDKTPTKTINFRLKADLIAKLELYSQYLDGSSTSYIVSQSLSTMFDTDKEFLTYLAAHPLPVVAANMRKRGRPKVVQATAA